MTDVPFMPKKGQPPFWLRNETPEEVDQHRSMVETQERLKKDFEAVFGKKDGK